jgi:hypothetical protein
MRRFTAWLRRHSLHVSEATWYALAVLVGLYQIVATVVALPLLPSEFFFPILSLLLLGLYISARWASWTDGPRLVLSDLLELDSIDVWRFTCWNRGKACEARARVVGATDDRGNALIDRQHLPIELPWTHYQGLGRLRVGRNDPLGITSALVFYGYQSGTGQRRFRGRPRLAVFAYGDKWQPVLGQVSCFRNRTLAITVAVDAPESYPDIEAVEHTYHLTFDRAAKARFRATP